MRSSASPPPVSWHEAPPSDEFLRRVCGGGGGHPFIAAQQLIVVSVIIVAVTVCDLRTRILPIFPTTTTTQTTSSFNGPPRRSSTRAEDRGAAKPRQAIIYKTNQRSRWTAVYSLGQFLYSQQRLNHVVVVVQCNQHHREMRHRGRTLLSIIPLVYKIIANNSYTYLLSVVDSKQHPVGIARIVHSKKILVECFIFAYLISLDLYS